MIEGAFGSLKLGSDLVALPLEGILKKQHFRIVRPKWKLIVWHASAFVFHPLVLCHILYTILNEYRKDSGSIDYLLYQLFFASLSSMGLALNLHTALKWKELLEAMNQAFILDKFLQGTIIFIYNTFKLFSKFKGDPVYSNYNKI